jgi:hypothetical protein
MLERAKTRSVEMTEEAALGHTAVLVKVAALMQAEQEEGMSLILGAKPNAEQLAKAASTLRDISAQLTTLLPQVPQAVRPPILQTVTFANELASRLTGTIVGPQSLTLPSLRLPVAPDASTMKPSNTTTSGGGNAGTPSTPTDPGEGNQPGDGGDHKTSDIRTPPEACQVPGSANGLTDVTAPLAKVFCTD